MLYFLLEENIKTALISWFYTIFQQLILTKNEIWHQKDYFLQINYNVTNNLMLFMAS